MAKIVADDVLLAAIQLTFLPAFKLWWLSICQPGVISERLIRPTPYFERVISKHVVVVTICTPGNV
jgi:hypothetical protein